MFKVTSRPKFRWRVSFKWAADDNTFETHDFVAIFRRLPSAELAVLAHAIQQSGFGFEERVKFCDAVVEGFDEIEHDGTKEALRAWMFADASIVNALFTEYSHAIQGIETKNSETSPAALSV
jgi:hypothetical protein